MRRSVAFLAAATFMLVGTPDGAVGQDPRPLTLEDYGSWSRITQVVLSPDGMWLAYALDPNEGDATFFVRRLDGDGLHEAVNGAGAEFSDGGGWVAFLTTPPEEDADKLRKEGEPVPRTLHLIDLRSGDRSEEAGVRSFGFSGDGRFLAIHRDRSDPDAEHQGSDLLLQDLQAGTVLSLGNVSQFAFNESGSHLAYLVDAAGKAGNGAYLVAVADGRIRPVNTGPHTFEDLTWNEAGDALAVLRGSKPDEYTERDNVLVVVAEATSMSPEVTIADPSADPSFPEGFVLSEQADTRWTEDGARVLVGLKEQKEEVEEPDEETADVDVWHWSDERLQSVQRVQAGADRRYTYLAAYNVDSGRLIRLASDDVRRVDIPGDGRWAVGRNDAAYRGDLDEDGQRADYIRIDPTTGEDRLIVEEVRRPMGFSPDGAWFVYVKDGAVQSTNLESLETTNLSAASGIDFLNAEFDLVAERPAYGVGGWTEEGSVILYTRYEAYVVPLDGRPARALTGGLGDREEIRFRIVRLDPEEDWVDPDGVLLSAYGEWTKKSGYFRARPGRDPEELLFGDEMIGQVRKASDADRLVFTRQTFERFPDYWTSDLSFGDPQRVTDANPQISEFAWGRRVLVDYVNQRGIELQATLALPAGYEEGRRYPMIVYFYEKMSQRHHQFSMPVYDDRPHMSTYASNGYLVLMPDIVYDAGYPGSSALDDVTAAARKAIELGYADPDRIGLQGHSWGGYETSFILTQTDMFAAIVTGAPLTNLMSMNNILYKRTGSQNGPILQWNQGRMGDQPWDDFERWVSQSPVHHAPNISTPFLILHGTDDGAVDWNQGLELYTAARRLGKEVILLSYPGEPHHLGKEANQKDFQIRMRQYFDHHLKGAGAPAWMRDGVPFLEKGREGAEKTRTVS